MIKFKDWFEFRDSILKALGNSYERGQVNNSYLEKELEDLYKEKEIKNDIG